MKLPLTLPLDRILGCSLACLPLLAGATASAQLAITEVMSSASTNLGPALVTQRADYWELTNFGTNDIPLDGYRWNDNQGGLIGADPTPFTNLTIRAGESIVFAQITPGVVTNDTQFREWWGPSLPAELQVRIFSGNGLGSGGDGIRVWSPTATADADVVDSVDFLEAQRGAAFEYDVNTGDFTRFASNGVAGAFRAVATDDIGSPGRTPGPVSLFWRRQPVNTTIDPGLTVTLTGVAGGLPRARYRWFHDGNLIAGATATNLVLTDVKFADAGTYRIEADNGLMTLSSTSAVLIVNGAPAPPVIASGPSNLTVTAGQSAVFSVVVSGNPLPALQWYFNHAPLPGQTADTLTVNGVTPANAGLYSVTASNIHGTTFGGATLAVLPRALLVITEAMSSQSTNGGSGRGDWWELTSFDNRPVNLRGYRWDDTPGLLATAFRVTNDIIIQPGESVIFAEGMSRNAFLRWWGSNNVPANLQVITYTGNGLSSLGDEINLWDATATDELDKTAADVFSTATPGVSFGYDPVSQTFGDLSVLGQHGAFMAETTDDIGSPGYITNPPPKVRFTKVMRDAAGVTLTWRSLPGQTFRLWAKASLADPAWTLLGTYPATGGITTALDADAANLSRRIYQLELLP